MADTKISAAADPGTLVATDKVPLARSASTTAYAASLAEVATYAHSTLVAGSGIANTGGTISNAGVLTIDSATGAILLGTGLTRSSQTISTTSTVTVGLSNNLTDTIPVGTYDLGPVIQGGTVLNSYAHVASGTLTYTAAIGAPGSLTNITGMVALTAATTTSDSVGTATAANVLTAGQHLWVIVAGTAAPGATVFLTIRVP